MSGSGLLGMVNRPWLEVPKEPLQEGSRLSHPCYDPWYSLLMPIPQDLLYPFVEQPFHTFTYIWKANFVISHAAKKDPVDFLHHSFGHSFFWPKRLLEKGKSTRRSSNRIDQLSLPIQSNLSLEPRPSACPLLVPLPLLDDRFKAPKSESIHSSRCWIDCGDKVDHSIIASSNSWIKISD